MLLAVDIGNTNITFGVYENDKLIKTYRLISDINKYKDYYINSLHNILVKPTKCCIVSVVDELSIKIKEACDEYFGIESFLFDTKSLSGVILDVEKPETVGADRIANAYCAYKRYNSACIVVDSGSATTFDIISSDGKFYGGIIMPGLEMQLNSLYEKTSKLPKYEIEEINSVIGRDTKTCILSGVIRGHACAIEGLIKECEKEINEKVTIIATGGLSSLISKYMNRKFDHIEPNLTLDGIKYLYELNN